MKRNGSGACLDFSGCLSVSRWVLVSLFVVPFCAAHVGGAPMVSIFQLADSRAVGRQEVILFFSAA
jgi:hypothetical protein